MSIKKKHSKPEGPEKIKLLSLIFASLILLGCAGGRSASSPGVYATASEEAKERVVRKTDSKPPASANELSEKNSKAVETEKSARDPEKAPPETSNSTVPGNALETHQNLMLSGPNYGGAADFDDSAAAVDDFIWRQFELADEYHAMGAIANREGSWEEAQYYFEKALKILAGLDIESETTDAPEAKKYSTILANIIADYRVSLRSLGNLTEEASAAVIIERFGDLAKSLGDDSMRVFSSEISPVTYSLPIVMNERVKSSVIYFQTVAKDAFAKYLRRSKKYTPMMKKHLREYGLPEDLIYLSLVESGYNPHAYSWARAMGLWQFISSTGRMFGLKRNWWMDERKDPEKSTDAACRFLKELYEKFGSWELAMAAYNGGPGRVERTIKKQKTMDFWKLRLKRQTMDYVPLIMAATIIAKDPERYGFENIVHESEVVWDVVEIDRCLDLSIVAREIGCSLNDLKALNPELLRKYTPPNVKKYRLKIPIGKKPKFIAAYDSMPSPKETSWVRHKIRRGETVSTIAARYGVSQYAIFEANNLKRRSRIYAGKQLIVPVPLDREYNARNRTKKYNNYSSKNSMYVVRSGDTMWDIARAFGTSVSALRRINYIDRGSRIYVGQKLKLPSSAKNIKKNNKSASKSPLLYSSKNSNNSQKRSTKSKSTKARRYSVRSGDTLWDIARKFGTTTSRLRRLNGLGRSSRIYPGQVLQVVGDGGSGFIIHKVRRGDTLGRLARKYRTSITRIMTSNGLTDPNEIRVGLKLKIYLK